MPFKTRIMLGAAGAAALTLAAATAFALGAGGHDPMTMFDADGNQALSLAEVRQGAQTMFGRVDANKDGRVTAEEYRAHHGKEGHRRGPDGAGKGGPPEAGRDGPGHGPMHMDKDGDGAVSLAEMSAELEGHFNRADANRDGSVTREEMEAAHRSMRDRH
jgi:hypothetical protein